MNIVRRRGLNVRCRKGVAVALACCLLLGISGCQPRRCAVHFPDRAIDAPVALATALQTRVASALESPDPVTLAIDEQELTALLRQALAGSPVRDATLHITTEALYLQATIGRTPLRAAIAPAIERERLVARVACITVGDRPLPRLTGAAIDSVVAALATDAAWALRVESVTLDEGTVTLVAERRVASYH